MLNFAALWTGILISIFSYMSGGVLVSIGFNWRQALIITVLSGFAVSIFIMLIGRIGLKYRITFPVLLRSSFGLEGARFAAMLRSVIFCGWFSILSWQCSKYMYYILNLLFSGKAFLNLNSGDSNALQLYCFLIILFVQGCIICSDMGGIKKLEVIFAPFLVIMAISALTACWVKIGSLTAILKATNNSSGLNISVSTLFAATAAITAGLSPLVIIIPDFTRFAKKSQSQWIGQLTGLSIGIITASFAGIFMAGASKEIFGKIILDPVTLITAFHSPALQIIWFTVLLIAVLTTNIAAYAVTSANDFSNLFPKLITFRTGGILTCLTGIFFLPWTVLTISSHFMYLWLIAYSPVLSAVAGIILCDYYCIKKRTLDIKSLYSKANKYNYSRGWNIKALISLIIATGFNAPGFCIYTNIITLSSTLENFFKSAYIYSCPISLILSFIIYYYLMNLSKILVRTIPSIAE
ncbi:MAG: cytosine permease [Victivallales bacterium]|nr:cytosine permease [Victivallales bacterium]